MRRSTAERLGVEILAKHIATSVVGVSPRVMGIGPVPYVLLYMHYSKVHIIDNILSVVLFGMYFLRVSLGMGADLGIVSRVLERTGLSKDDVDLYEVSVLWTF